MNRNDSAFPGQIPNPETLMRELISVPGMTKREYFAIRSFQSLLPKADSWEQISNFAIKAVICADQLIAALEKK